MIWNVVIWRRSLRKSKFTYMICTFPQIFFYSSTTRQEFGRQFEEIAAESLRKFSFDVTVCGGPKDRGIDFKGFWRLKSTSVPIIGQCRRYKRRLGPKHVRELEGTLTHEVNGTLGIIVSESGFSRDAYGVFKGSLYPIAFSILKGFSDDLLRWYSDEQSDETFIGDKSQISTRGESFQQVQYKIADIHLPGESECTDDLKINFVGKHDKEAVLLSVDSSLSGCSKRVFSWKHTHTNLDQQDTLNNDRNSVGGNVINVHSHTSNFADNSDDFKQLRSSNISEMATGVFTMFELNPSAQKLLPHVVVGLKYRRHNFNAPELFIKEED